MQREHGVAMSETGRADLAYPKSKFDAKSAFWFIYCGGSGGGGCLTALGVTQYVYSIRVPKFTVLNRSLILQNNNSIDIGSNGGFDGLCTDTYATRQPWYLAFSADGILTDAQVISKGKMFNQAAFPAYDIFVQAKDLPQPKDANWQGRIYVHLVWGSPTFVNRGGDMHPDMLTVIKHDMDEKI